SAGPEVELARASDLPPHPLDLLPPARRRQLRGVSFALPPDARPGGCPRHPAGRGLFRARPRRSRGSRVLATAVGALALDQRYGASPRLPRGSRRFGAPPRRPLRGTGGARRLCVLSVARCPPTDASAS